jgi:MFS family permease
MTPRAQNHPRMPLFRILIYGLFLASAAAQFAIVPIMPVYAHQLGLSGFQQGMVLGATGLAMLAVCLPAGALSDRLGAHRLTLCAGVLMAAALFAQSLAGSFPLLLGARLMFGVGYGVMWTAGLSWIAGTAGRGRAPDGDGRRTGAGAKRGGGKNTARGRVKHSAGAGRAQRAGGSEAHSGSGLGGPVACAGVGGVAGPAASGALVQHFGPALPALATAAGFALITAGLGALRVPAGPGASAAPVRASLRAAVRDRAVVCTAAAILIVGITTGVPALLVPAELHAAGASPGRIGLDFAIAGMLFALGSTLTVAAGRRALRMTVLCAALLALTAALLPAALTSAPLAIVAMLCATTAARSVLWTVSYPLAAEGARQTGAGLGVVVGALNGVWAATAVLGPLAAGLGVEHVSPRAVFGLTEALCVVVLAATVVLAGGLLRRRGRASTAIGGDPGTLKASRAWRDNAAAEIPHRDARTEHGRCPRPAARDRGRPRGSRQADRRGRQQLHRVRARARALARGGAGGGRGRLPGRRGTPRVQHDRGR